MTYHDYITAYYAQYIIGFSFTYNNNLDQQTVCSMIFNSLCVCVRVQFVHVGSARVDSEAVHWSVGGLHLLLPAAVQTAGIYHRYVIYSMHPVNVTLRCCNHHTFFILCLLPPQVAMQA